MVLTMYYVFILPKDKMCFFEIFIQSFCRDISVATKIDVVRYKLHGRTDISWFYCVYCTKTLLIELKHYTM